MAMLIHGAGGSGHSWRDLILPLAETRDVVAIDLPGQGLTRAGTWRRSGLEPMTEDIAALCAAQGWRPDMILGHSAGAALARNEALKSITKREAAPATSRTQPAL